MDQVRALFSLLGFFRYEPTAIATLTGLATAQVEAFHRLGLIIVVDGDVVSVRP